jgi:hypothetical protein
LIFCLFFLLICCFSVPIISVCGFLLLLLG